MTSDAMTLMFKPDALPDGTLQGDPTPPPRLMPLRRLGHVLADLPPANTTRWVIRRKAAVVAAVRDGLLSLDEACARYQLSHEEFATWQRLVDRHGLPGLRATRIQEYRQADKETVA